MHLIALVNYYCTCWGFAIDQLVLEYLLHRCVTLIKQMWLHTYQFLFGFKAQNPKVTQLAEQCGAVLARRMQWEALHWGNAGCLQLWEGNFSHEWVLLVCKCHCMNPRREQTNQPWIFLEHLQICSLIYREMRDYSWRTYRKTNLKTDPFQSRDCLELVLA